MVYTSALKELYDKALWAPSIYYIIAIWSLWLLDILYSYMESLAYKCIEEVKKSGEQLFPSSSLPACSCISIGPSCSARAWPDMETTTMGYIGLGYTAVTYIIREFLCICIYIYVCIYIYINL